MNFHGKHATIDLKNFIIDSKVGGQFIFDLMVKSLELSTCREVHKKLVILGLEGESPPGFTSVVLIDESHITAHCYSDRGWLAIDVFTCGTNSSPLKMIDFIYNKIVESYPEVIIVQKKEINRFPL
jgi:S-adenosylmethionine decarboxylase